MSNLLAKHQSSLISYSQKTPKLLSPPPTSARLLAGTTNIGSDGGGKGVTTVEDVAMRGLGNKLDQGGTSLK